MVPGQQLVTKLVDLIIDPLIYLLFTAGFFFFMFGLVKFLWNLRGGEVANDGKQHMLWGLIGMFVMMSAFAIISLIMNTFGINSQTATDTSNADSFSPNINIRM